MAQDREDKAPQSNTSSNEVAAIISGMVKDVDDTYIPEGAWSHARNATKVTANGSLNTLSNEPSLALCLNNITTGNGFTDFTIIGSIHLFEDKWAIFSTNNAFSEIGLYDDSECRYDRLVIDPCTPVCDSPGVLEGNATALLAFNTRHLIKGASKQNFDCTWSTYFADGSNPDRVVTIDVDQRKIVDYQFVQCVSESVSARIPLPSHDAGKCYISTPTCKIDTEQIRLASLMDSPCVTISRSKSGGSLLNGSYFVVIGYSINSQLATSYFPPSNVQPIFVHTNLGGSIDIRFSGLDTTHFSEFSLVLVRTSNLQTSAKLMGTYSTHTQEMTIDNINESLPNVPIEQIPVVNPVPEKSEAIYSVGDYLLRIAPTNRFDFNYQPLANKIGTKWVSVEYPSSYYRDGGNNPSYLRDEIYSFFIRWIYNTGDRSSSYHIPGRPPRVYTFPGTALPPQYEDTLAPNVDRLENDEYVFETFNTASMDTTLPSVLSTDDGGVIIAQGDMGYWQSSERYPDNKFDIWGDLCGKFIRHHKFPDNQTPGDQPGHPNVCNHIYNYGTPDSPDVKIRVMGVMFNNISLPVDNNNQLIPGIVGYEILRGSREGNKTVIAKGIINNMRGYTINGVNANQRPGLYQNYPYNWRGPDSTLRTEESLGGWTLTGQPGDDLTDVKYDTFTFHSPETSFRHPFLAVNELKVYGETTAQIVGSFDPMPYHPREKLLGNMGFLIAAMVGVGEAILAVRGQRSRLNTGPYTQVIGLQQSGYTVPIMYGQTNQSSYSVGKLEAPLDDVSGNDARRAVLDALRTANTAASDGNGVVNILSILGIGLDTSDLGVFNANQNYTATPGVNSGSVTYTKEESPFDRTTGFLGNLGGVIIATNYWAIGTDTALRLIQAIIPYEQYAYRYTSHGYYNSCASTTFTGPGYRRYRTDEQQYLDSQRQQFRGAEVNNLYRSQAVVVHTDRTLPDSVQPENSFWTIGTSPPGKPGPTFSSQSTSYYTALIQRIKSQYGQLDSIIQVPLNCRQLIDPSVSLQSSQVLFGGDTYITRYTEKNTFFYFYDWLMDQPNGFEFDYRTRYMLTYPRYWADFTSFEPSDFVNNIIPAITTANLGALLPTQKAALDDPLGGGNNSPLAFLASMIQFRVKPGYFYISQSGVRDFFVESEVNTDLRDWGDIPAERFYDPQQYTSLYDLFDPKIIKAGNYFKYDYSLSISKLYLNFASWGAIQSRDYDPYVAETCYVQTPKRLLYSLPQNLENKRDYWRVFLANNYKDFYSKVSVIKSFNQNGAIILFTNDSPILWKGVDQLETSLATKVTIGDGGLFSQPDQSIVNVDISYEYGSCQDRLSVINTPFGLYYMSSSQGKIFNLTQQLDDITYSGLKFWFKEYLPFKLLEDFPNFDILDNPVVGIGCQSIYDNQIETIYFCKKDYKLKEGYTGTYDSVTGRFSINAAGTSEGIPVEVSIGDPDFSRFFYDASWTVSFDPKSEKGGWISFHDWHPDLNIPSRNNFLSIVHDSDGRSSVWRHNQRRDDFCNYYDTYYPFEVEYIASTKLSVNTLRSIEYYMECYRYAPGRLDKFHMLNWNFDRAIVYNTEQVSGLLNLNLSSPNDPWGNLQFPRLTAEPAIDILYNKVEQKYRFNQFWDITDNRGEFTQDMRMIWITEPNGYIRALNGGNLNYVKAQTQRKKFRHYTNRALLTKAVPSPGETNPINMTIKVALNKNLLSLR